MQEQKYIYNKDPQDVINAFADKINALPYDVLFTQFEGSEEVFFSFAMEAYDDELEAIILSMISLMIKEDGVEASAVTTISNTSESSLDSLALIKQTNLIASMFLECGFEVAHDHEHEHEHHEHECTCEDGECTCDDGESCGDPDCHCHHVH